MGKAGLEDGVTSAFAPEDAKATEPASTPAEKPSPYLAPAPEPEEIEARQRDDEDYDREPVEREPRRAREPEIRYDPVIDETALKGMADQAVQQWAQQYAAPLIRELNALPDPSRMSREQAQELYDQDPIRFQQMLTRRGQIEMELNHLPTVAEQQRSLHRGSIAQIVSARKEFASKNPEYAGRVFDIVARLDHTYQASPATYDFALQQIMGQEAREQRERKAQRAVARRASVAGRGSAPSAPVVDSSKAIKMAKTMKLKGRFRENYLRSVTE